jgi:hypothetical protein
MPRLLFIWVAALWLSGALQGQNFYIKPQVRYHSPLTHQVSPEYFNAAIIVPTSTGNYYTYIITRNNKFSLARGLSYGVSAGYRISDKVSVESGFYYFQNKEKFASDDVYPHYPIGSTSWQFRSFNFTPSLVFAHTSGNFTLSAKAGFLAGLTSLGRSIFFDFKRKTFKFNTSFSTGYTFGIELGWHLANNFVVSAETGIENQFYTPRKARIQYDDFTYYRLDQLPVYLREIIYVREIDNETVIYDSQSDTYFTNQNKPLMRLKEPLKMNSFYTGIGIKFNFGNR